MPWNPHHFLDDVRRPIDVTAPARRTYLPGLAALDAEAEPFEDSALFGLGHVDAGQRQRARWWVGDHAIELRRRARADDFGCLPARQLQRHRRGEGQPRVEKRRIDAAFEAGAGVGGEAELLAGAGDRAGIEISAFDQDVGRAFLHAGFLSAHDAADVVHMALVGDHVMLGSSA
jgi:hypothetical protein